jgi:hypothetical protein
MTQPVVQLASGTLDRTERGPGHAENGEKPATWRAGETGGGRRPPPQEMMLF